MPGDGEAKAELTGRESFGEKENAMDQPRKGIWSM